MYSLQSGWQNPCRCPIILLCILYRAVGRIPTSASLYCYVFLTERLAESLRVPHQAPSIMAQVFLCVRVLILRMSCHQLTSLWPTVITEMVLISLSLCWSLSVHCVFLSFTCMSICSSVSPFFCLSFVCLSVLFLSVCYKHKCHI